MTIHYNSMDYESILFGQGKLNNCFMEWIVL